MNHARVAPPRGQFFVAMIRVVLCIGLPVGSPLMAASARADAVGLVRSASPSIPANLQRSVDDAVLRELAHTADIQHPTVSPAAYEEIQLAVGCEGETRSCLSSIAQTLHADAIVITRLSSDDSGIVTLELMYFAAGADREVSRAQVTAQASARATIVDAVPGLVRRVFGVAEPAAPRAAVAPAARAQEPNETPIEPSAGSPDSEATPPPPYIERSHGARIAPLTWGALITGAVVLGVGVGMGASAHGSFSDLKATPVRTAADARRVHSDFDSIETRATVANVMMPLGGAVLGVGAVLLVLDLTKHQPNDERDSEARIDVVPLRGGGALTFRSALGAW